VGRVDVIGLDEVVQKLQKIHGTGPKSKAFGKTNSTEYISLP
jgi:hypothetical protein